MTTDDLRSAISSLRDEARARLSDADTAAVEELRVELLGRSGRLTALLRTLGELAPDGSAGHRSARERGTTRARGGDRGPAGGALRAGHGRAARG